MIDINRFLPWNLPYRLYPFKEFLENCKKLGIHNIELSATAPHFLLGPDGYEDCRAFRKSLDEYEIQCKVFNPECVTYPFPMCNGNKLISDKTLRYYENAILAAKELGAELVILSLAGVLKDEDQEKAVQRGEERLKQIAVFAQKEGMTIALETLTKAQSPVINTIKELKTVIDNVGMDAVRPALDICPMSMAGESIDEWFDTFDGNIAHIHFSDGNPGERLIWGEGVRPMNELLQAINRRNYKGYFGLNTNIRGTWFEEKYLDSNQGFVGKDMFIPQNYWFAPHGADNENINRIKASIG